MEHLERLQTDLGSSSLRKEPENEEMHKSKVESVQLSRLLYVCVCVCMCVYVCVCVCYVMWFQIAGD